MKSFLILIICLLFIVKNQDTTYSETYSISSFIGYLQEMGYWEILSHMNLYFGINITIQFCQTFIPSPHCDEVMRVYINNSGSKTRGMSFDEDDSEPNVPEEDYYLNINQMDNFLDENGYYNILSQNIPESILDSLIDKFMKQN